MCLLAVKVAATVAVTPEELGLLAVVTVAATVLAMAPEGTGLEATVAVYDW